MADSSEDDEEVILVTEDQKKLYTELVYLNTNPDVFYYDNKKFTAGTFDSVQFRSNIRKIIDSKVPLTKTFRELIRNKLGDEGVKRASFSPVAKEERTPTEDVKFEKKIAKIKTLINNRQEISKEVKEQVEKVKAKKVEKVEPKEEEKKPVPKPPAPVVEKPKLEVIKDTSVVADQVQANKELSLAVNNYELSRAKKQQEKAEELKKAEEEEEIVFVPVKTPDVISSDSQGVDEAAEGEDIIYKVFDNKKVIQDLEMVVIDNTEPPGLDDESTVIQSEVDPPIPDNSNNSFPSVFGFIEESDTNQAIINNMTDEERETMEELNEVDRDKLFKEVYDRLPEKIKQDLREAADLQAPRDPTTEPGSGDFAVEEVPIDHPAKYYKMSVLFYFGSINRPEWDTELEKNVFDSKMSKQDIISFSDSIIFKHGKDIFVSKRANDSIEQFHELIQLQFCILRNLARGIRTKSALVPISSLMAFSSKLNGNRSTEPVPNNAPNNTPDNGRSDVVLDRPEGVPEPENDEILPGGVQPNPLGSQVQVSEPKARNDIIDAYRNRPLGVYNRPVFDKGLIASTKVHYGLIRGTQNLQDPTEQYIKKAEVKIVGKNQKKTVKVNYKFPSSTKVIKF
jgi:hypothetical protein